MHYKKLAAGIALSALLVGCASVAVNNDSLTQRTSNALGLSPDQFTISNRSDSGVRTDYSVHTSAGKTYACYVTGTFSVTGRIVSDAICSTMQAGAPSSQATNETTHQPCNALLKAAGKCQ